MLEHSRDEIEPVIEAIRRWAIGHPKAGEPFMVVRGHAFSPQTFLEAVLEHSEFAAPFLEYVFEQAREEGVPPREIIDRETRKQR